MHTRSLLIFNMKISDLIGLPALIQFSSLSVVNDSTYCFSTSDILRHLHASKAVFPKLKKSQLFQRIADELTSLPLPTYLISSIVK